MNQHVFVNRTLNMKRIKYIGLDMDHTLIRYKTKNFESLVYQLVIEELINTKAYPREIQELQFNFSDAIRGLVVDSNHGNILKLNRYGAIRHSYHGTKAIEFTEQKKIYRSIYVDLGDPNYMAIDTFFSIAFCVLYRHLVDFKDQRPYDLPNYSTIAKDVLSSVDKVHGNGSLKHQISLNLEEFVERDEELVAGLKRYIQYGKKIFILTNSEYYYSKLLLDYAINPFLTDGETWRDLFEYVITLSNKPRFFYDKLKFLKIDPNTDSMTNTLGKISPGIYQGGSATQFADDLCLNGDEILYIGDHIYGDILRLKKDCNWRTALVVDELGEEINSQEKARPIEKEISSEMSLKITLELQYIGLQTLSIDEASHQYDNELQQLQLKINTIDNNLTDLLQKEHMFYNITWGRVFRAGAEESYFAYQVERFACIYMEKLSDLFDCSPLTYFRAGRRHLPHDLDLT